MECYKCKIHPDHRHHDLGLRLIHETLVFVRDAWTLAAAVPCNLGNSKLQWKTPKSKAREKLWSELGPNHGGTSAERAADDALELQIRQHFGRLGFLQADPTPSLEEYYFLTHQD